MLVGASLVPTQDGAKPIHYLHFFAVLLFELLNASAAVRTEICAGELGIVLIMPAKGCGNVLAVSSSHFGIQDTIRGIAFTAVINLSVSGSFLLFR